MAIALALANDPPVILADEPTANLDDWRRQRARSAQVAAGAGGRGQA